MRSRIKEWLVDAWCAGWLPAWVVRVAFVLFGLKHV
jgi:hypothetical protein